jgi:hypothetical protein
MVQELLLRLKRFWMVSGILFIILTTVACDTKATPKPVLTFAPRPTNWPSPTYKNVPPPDPTSVALGDYLRASWLQGVPYKPPSWQGLWPGKTTVGEAIEILSDNTLISETEIFEFEEVNSGEISWNWADYPKSGGRAFYQPLGENGVIYAILPGFGCCLRLGDIVDKYGPPSHALVWRFQDIHNPATGNFSYRIVWMSQGFQASGFPENGTMIDEDFWVYSVTLFEPSDSGYYTYEPDAWDELFFWHGYDSRDTYLSEK